MTQVALPPVAKSFFTFCKKCDADRYHRVLAHTSSTSAKIECEICHSKKTYSLPKAGSSSTKKNGVAKTAGARASSRRSHSDEFNTLMMNRGQESGTPFSIRTKYEINQKIDHVKFGPGFVKNVMIDRIDVMFEEEIKTLMHNKV